MVWQGQQNLAQKLYLILVGDSGLDGLNVGNSFELAAKTAAAELRATGNEVVIQRVSSLQDVNAALTGNGLITGGVSYYGHSGIVPMPDGSRGSGIAPGQGAGADTDITYYNVSFLSGKNLGKDATISIMGCFAGSGGKNSIAQQIANQLGRKVSAYDVGMFFSTDRSTKRSSKATVIPNSTPMYMLPEGQARPIIFKPQE